MRLERLFLGLLRTRVALSGPTLALSRHQLDELIRETEQPDLNELNWKSRIELNWKARIALGWLLLRQGDNKQAASVLSRVRDETARARFRPIQCLATLALASADLAGGRLDDAHRHATALVELAGHFEGRLLAAKGNLLLSDIARANDASEKAVVYERRAIDIAGTILSQVPDSLTSAFLENYPWAKATHVQPLEQVATDGEKKGSQ